MVLGKAIRGAEAKKILEYGSGGSTTIFSDYADKHGAKVTSEETDKGWAELVRRHIGENVTIVECSASGDAQSDPKALRFDVDFGDEQFDFVLIDGPGNKFPGIAKKEGVTMNALELAQSPEMIIVDGRKATANYMKQHSKMVNYNFVANDLHVSKVLMPGYHFFSVLKRN